MKIKAEAIPGGGLSREVQIVSKNRGAVHLLEQILSAKNRIFYMDDRPPGWLLLERRGLAYRVIGDSLGRAELTAKGEALAKELRTQAQKALL